VNYNGTDYTLIPNLLCGWDQIHTYEEKQANKLTPQQVNLKNGTTTDDITVCLEWCNHSLFCGGFRYAKTGEAAFGIGSCYFRVDTWVNSSVSSDDSDCYVKEFT
jgi:hypothetical protein